ncbi:MAG: molybdopterin-synthase adenylyltransferase MoeB [Propionibacteriaceae bacterium]|nr:molybdopterin-synthase adenylyltransferase MoeB [Propionibacteriaceae bacterium]
MPRPLPLDPGPELTVAEFSRYSRQLVLPAFGVEGQRRLRAAKVLVLGAGGLGSPVLLYLAAAGVGTLGIVDFDQVEESNLHRQVIHPTAAVGRSKVASAVDAVRALNPGVTVVAHDLRLTEANAAGVFAGYDVVLDGTDNFPTRYLANDTCLALGIPLVWASVLGFAAQISVFWPAGGGPQLRDLFPEPPEPGSVPNCAEAGVIGALCGQVGSIMATEAIKLLTGLGAPLLGRVLVVDSLAGSWDELPLRASDHAEAPPLHVPQSSVGSGVLSPEIPDRVGDDGELGRPHEAGQLSTTADPTPDDVRLLDVREPAEFAEGHLPGSLNLPLAAVLAGEEVPDDRPVLVICRSGARARVAAAALAARGHRTEVLEGGLLGLTSAG